MRQITRERTIAGNIKLFTGTLLMEVEAYTETESDHDRKRALKAVEILEKYTAELRAALEKPK